MPFWVQLAILLTIGIIIVYIIARLLRSRGD
jgi:uncharacterized membrane-anchored protein YhcB (DUF1043 family)